MYRILVVDDEKEITKLLKLYLEKDDINVVAAYDGQMALALFLSEPFDLAIVDVMMPKMNGFELIKEMRKYSNIPIIIISAKIETTDKIFGLEMGADDYITKPFDGLEVAARVKASLRRIYQMKATNKNQESSELKIRNLILYTNQCTILVDSIKKELTAVEYKVLKLFMQSPGRVFTKEQIYEAGWGESYAVDDNTIRVIISKIRDKIGEDNIKTIRGLGYRLEK